MRAGRPAIAQLDVVAVGTDGGHASAQIVLAGGRQRLGQADASPVGDVDGGDLGGAVGHRVVGLGQHRSQSIEEVLAGGGQGPARLDELGVEHVEGERRALVEAAVRPP